MEVTRRKSSMIRPATPNTPSHHLWLSALDLRQMMLFKHVPLLYFYKPNGSPDFFRPQVLKEALSNVLVPFYPAAGRLGRDENGRIEIICNARGVLFVEAETTTALADLGDFAPGSELEQLVPFVDYSKDLSFFPLILLQVTRFKCGGVCLGVQTHHVLTDGPSAFHFLTSWCDMASGKSISILPFFGRTIMKSLMAPASTFHHIEFDPPPSMNGVIKSSTTTNTSALVSTITADQLKVLKGKSIEFGNNNYSTFCIVVAHLWRCVTAARDLPKNQATKLTFPMDARSKLTSPPLPQGYFGNAVFTASTIALTSNLLSESFANTVKRIHVTIIQQNVAYIKSALAMLENHQGSYLQGEEHPHKCPNLYINKLSRFSMHGMDFGWGAPVILRRATLGEGMIYILPPNPTDDGLTFIVGLETSHVKNFQDFVFRSLYAKL